MASTDSNAPFVQLIDTASIHVADSLNRWQGSRADLELKTSIETQGLLQPIGVAPATDDTFDLAWGSRRFGAWTRSPFLKTEPIPAVVVTQEAALHGMLDENALRRQLSSVDKAKVAKYALDRATDPNVTQHALATSLGMSPSRLSNLKRAWEQPELWARVEAEALPLKSALLISRLPAEKQSAFLANLDANHPNATSADVERLARDFTDTGFAEILPGDDLRASAASLLNHFVQNSPGVSDLGFKVAYDVATEKPMITLHLPLLAKDADSARALIDHAKSMLSASLPTPPSEVTLPPDAPPVIGTEPPSDMRRPAA